MSASTVDDLLYLSFVYNYHLFFYFLYISYFLRAGGYFFLSFSIILFSLFPGIYPSSQDSSLYFLRWMFLSSHPVS